MSDADTGQAAPQSAHSRHLPAALGVLLVLTLIVRLPGIGRPLLGNFATRNVVSAMVARNWAEGHASLWYPTVDLLQGGRRSLIMLEFPVSTYLTAALWRTFGGSLDVWGRSTAVAFSVASVALMFLFVRRRHGPTVATAAGLALAISPVSIIYGQSFMLEASLVCFTLATFYALDRWLDGEPVGWLAAAAVCLSLLLLTKIYMLVVLLPLAVMVLRAGGNRRVRILALTAAATAILPAACWYAHAMHTTSPEGPLAERIYFSVRRSAADHYPPHPLLGSPDFYRHGLDNLAGVVLTPVGFMLVLAGLLDRTWRRHATWLAAMVMLVAALPRKFHEMNYYYMAVLPPLCIIVGLGWGVIYRHLQPGRKAVLGLLLVAFVFSMRYAVRPAFVTPDEDRGVVAAGLAVQELTEKEEPVVTMHGTTIDLLYYCRRPGWAIAPDTKDLRRTLVALQRQNARYLVVVGHPLPGAAGRPIVLAEDYCVYLLPGAPVSARGAPMVSDAKGRAYVRARSRDARAHRDTRP